MLNIPGGPHEPPDKGRTPRWHWQRTATPSKNHRIDTPVLPLSPLQHAETARLAQCESGVPATLLPPDINRRVNAALSTLGHQPETAAGVPRRGAHYGQALYIGGTGAASPRLARRRRFAAYGRLRTAFIDELPAGINGRIGQLRRDVVSGAALRDALAELEARLVPAPPHTATDPAAAASGIRIACLMSAT